MLGNRGSVQGSASPHEARNRVGDDHLWCRAAGINRHVIEGDLGLSKQGHRAARKAGVDNPEERLTVQLDQDVHSDNMDGDGVGLAVVGAYPVESQSFEQPFDLLL
jgi:hypothetical protein